MMANAMSDKLRQLKQEKDGDLAPNEQQISAKHQDSAAGGTVVTIYEEEDVAPDEAELKRPKPVPKQNRKGSKKIMAELEATKELAEGNKEKYTRLLSEFDNMRERNEKENSKMFDKGAMDTLSKLLPVVDNLERALENIPGNPPALASIIDNPDYFVENRKPAEESAESAENTEEKSAEGESAEAVATEAKAENADADKEDNPERTPFENGVEKIYKQLIETMKKIGVEPMNVVGEQFDPNFHNAVIHLEEDKYGENVIVEEMQKGYMYKDTVLRHAMVKVAN